MRRLLLAPLALALVAPVLAQTTIYLRKLDATGAPLVLTGADTVGPTLRFTTAVNHTFTVGEVVTTIHVAGIPGANGVFKVSSVPDNRHFYVTALDDSHIQPAGTFVALAKPVAEVSRQQPYTLVAHPRVWFDGPEGLFTRSLWDTAGKANASNVAKIALESRIRTDYTISPIGNDNNDNAQKAALKWFYSGDAAALNIAKWYVNHPETVVQSNLSCPEGTANFCSDLRDANALANYPSYWLIRTMAAYTLIRSQLTTPERQRLADMVLNDLADGCTKIPQSTIGAATIGPNGAVTGDGTTDYTTLEVGGSIFVGMYGYVIKSISDSTHLTAARATSYPPTGNQTLRYARGWQTGDCGINWFVKHHRPSILSNSIDYSSGGREVSSVNNLSVIKARGFLIAGIALADDDPRAAALASQAYMWLVSHPFVEVFGDRSSGLGTAGGYGYFEGYIVSTFLDLQLILNRSVTTPEPMFADLILVRRSLALQAMTSLPGSPGLCDGFGEWAYSYGPCLITGSSYGKWHSLMLGWDYYKNTLEGKLMSWWLRTAIGGGAESGLASRFNSPTEGGVDGSAQFMGYTPGEVAPPLSELPKQFLFRATDGAKCLALGGACPNSINGTTMSMATSRTGTMTGNETLVTVRSMPHRMNEDHMGTETPTLHIFRKDPLLTGASLGWYAGKTDENSLVFDSAAGFGISNDSISQFNSKINRWAGEDPTGRTGNEYAYIGVDLTEWYAASAAVNAAYRNVVHIKPASAQDYVVVYDYAASSKPQKISTYWNYAQNGESGEGGTTVEGTMVTSTGPSNRLLAAHFSPSATNGLRLNGAQVSGSHAYQVAACAANADGECDPFQQTAEFVTVLRPDPTTVGIMPALEQLTLPSHWTGIEIHDPAKPAVILFARGVQPTSNGPLFTTHHTGTGQYVVTGLVAGRYAVTVDGAPVAGSPFRVTSGDTSLYFESTAGVVAVRAIKPATTIRRARVIGRAGAR